MNHIVKLTMSVAQRKHEEAAIRASANLPEPEKNIRELAEFFGACHDRVWDHSIQGQARHKAGERPEECGGCHAFLPFKEKK